MGIDLVPYAGEPFATGRAIRSDSDEDCDLGRGRRAMMAEAECEIKKVDFAAKEDTNILMKLHGQQHETSTFLGVLGSKISGDLR